MHFNFAQCDYFKNQRSTQTHLFFQKFEMFEFEMLIKHKQIKLLTLIDVEKIDWLKSNDFLPDRA